jgi:hypothetical protein
VAPAFNNAFNLRKGPGRARRGFATVIALVALAVAAAALLSLVALVVADSRRTHEALTAAQLRQLLIAGADAATDRTSTWDNAAAADGQSWSPTLPAALTNEGAALKLTAKARPVPQDAGPTLVDVQIDATCAGRNGGQTLHFQRGDGVWTLLSVDADSVR